MEFPHNLYLHLLLTLGIFGTACMLLLLFGATWRIYVGGKRGEHKNSYERGLVFAGLLLVGGFLVHEIIIEFLRHGTIDYIQFRFALLGIFLGLADKARANVAAAELATSEVAVDEAEVSAEPGRLTGLRPVTRRG